MPLERGAAARVEVELRHARVVRKPLVDPGALEPAREHAFLGRVDHAVPREVRRRGERRSPRRPGSASGAIRRGRRNVAARSADDEDRERQAARTPAPGPASSASIRTQSAPGTVSIPASFASCRNGRISGSASAATTPIAVGGDGATRQAGGEPDDEDDEPERDEVEAVAVVEAVVAPGRARERGDDEEPGGVGRGEQRDEGACRDATPRARPQRAPRARSGATATGTTAR